MKGIPILIAVVLATMSVGGWSVKTDATKERAAVEAAMQTASQALMKGDADLLATVLSNTDDFNVIGPDGLTRGFAEFDKSFRQWFSRVVCSLKPGMVVYLGPQASRLHFTAASDSPPCRRDACGPRQKVFKLKLHHYRSLAFGNHLRPLAPARVLAQAEKHA